MEVGGEYFQLNPEDIISNKLKFNLGLNDINIIPNLFGFQFFKINKTKCFKSYAFDY